MPKVTSEDKVSITTRREEHKQDSRQQQPQTRSHSHQQEAAYREALPTPTQVSPASFLITFQTILSTLPLEPWGPRLPQCPALWPEQLPCPSAITHNGSPLPDISSVQDTTSSRNPSLTAPTQRQVFLLLPASPHSPCTKPACALGGSLFTIVLASFH